jgi:multidrug resistance efflux pump
MQSIKTDKEELDHIQLRSDEIEDMVGVVPHWFLRTGISVIFFFILVILIGCWFFKYPEMITAKTTLVANNPPVSVVARTTGKIESLFVHDHQQVKENETLAIIENAANYDDVLKVQSLLEPISRTMYSQDSIQLILPTGAYQLGNIQSSFSMFQKHYNDYLNFLALGHHRKMIASVRREMRQQNKYLERLAVKTGFVKEQLSLSKKQFQRDSLLFKNEVISVTDYEKSLNQFIQAKTAYETNQGEMLSIKVQINRLEQSVLALESQRLEQRSQQLNTLKESYELLQAQLAGWEQSFLLRAPAAGTVTFTKYWAVNQNITAGDIAFTVVPDNFKYYIAKIQLPIQSSGKVRAGQKVIISLDEFPYMEFGSLTGKISSISLVADNGYYVAEVILPARLVTTYGKDITFRNELKGSAEIIVKQQRLLYRFVYPLRALWDRNGM